MLTHMLGIHYQTGWEQNAARFPPQLSTDPAVCSVPVAHASTLPLQPWHQFVQVSRARKHYEKHVHLFFLPSSSSPVSAHSKFKSCRKESLPRVWCSATLSRKLQVLILRFVLCVYTYLEYYRDWGRDRLCVAVSGYVRNNISWFAQVGILKSFTIKDQGWPFSSRRSRCNWYRQWEDWWVVVVEEFDSHEVCING